MLRFESILLTRFKIASTHGVSFSETCEPVGVATGAAKSSLSSVFPSSSRHLAKRRLSSWERSIRLVRTLITDNS